jgi:cell wall-associated NlpC family hydrolase
LIADGKGAMRNNHGPGTSRIVSVLLTLVVAATLAIVPAAAVRAVPGEDIASKSQQAAQVAQEIDALDKELAVATEAYNRVKVDLDEVSAKVDATRKKLDEIKQNLRERRGVLNQRALALYKNGRTSMLEVLLNTKNFADFLERADYVYRVAESDANLISKIKTTRDSVAELDRQLSEQQRQQEGLVEQEAAKKYQIEAKLSDRQNLLNGLNSDIQRLLAEQQQAQRAADQALDQQAQNTLVDAPEGGLAKTALKYLGVPYHWAGAGPGQCPTGEHAICFDCSGLTMYVYKLYGISLPHNAAMQFNRAIKVTLQQARAGDLVFFGMPPHHVGMYLGNDMFIQAPQTGDVVKVSKLSSRSDLSGIGRFTK